MGETYTGASLIKSTILAKSMHNELQVGGSEIPQFYFPKGKPVDIASERSMATSITVAIGEKSNDITNELSKKLLETIVGIPSYFSQLLIIRSTNNPKAEKMSRP